MAETRAYIALGSNLQDPIAQVRAGFVALQNLPHARLVGVSSLYRTAPVGDTDQPDFINAAAAIDTTLTAADLLDALLEIERHRGRVRDLKRSGGPRTLDLDLLLYGDEIHATPQLQLPHPRLHERAFVLAPLAEIAPDLRIPGRGTVAEWLRACRDQAIERLTDSNPASHARA